MNRFTENKQHMEFLFNAERLLSDSARGHLKKVDFSEIDSPSQWADVENEQHDSFTVNLANQLKITQNLQLIRCNILGRILIQ